MTDSKSLHYVFIESLSKSSDPILVWFNGGPGCSSLLGLFQEHGPFVFDDGETVIKPNPFPWNQRANLLYLESPAGVGFSVANNTDDLLHSDMSQSEDAFAALRQFYQAFPLLRDNDLYITGESYAGVYAPYLAWQIHEWNLVQNMNQWNDTYNLKGFIIGNGVTDMYLDSDSQMIESLANWNMIPSSLWDQIVANKCVFNWDKLDVKVNNAPACADLYNQAMGLIEDLNIYDLYRTQYGNTASSKKSLRLTEQEREREVVIDGMVKKYKLGRTMNEMTPFRKSLLTQDDKQVILGDDLSGYLNRADVRAALNIPTWVQGYSECNNPMYGTYQAFREGSIWIYHILKGYTDSYRLLHYSGDTDGAVATLGTRRWIAQQGWPVTKEWRTWTTNGDLSGYLEDYGTFTFATIHGVGHMAPQWKRQDVTELISKYVHNETIN